MVQAVGMPEMQRVFAVTDELGLSREAIKVPLAMGQGTLRRLADGRIEIVIDPEPSLEQFFTQLPARLREFLAQDAD